MLRLNFTTYSPLHISSGKPLAYNLDYVQLGNECGILDIRRLSAFLAKKNAFDFNTPQDLRAVMSKISRFKNEYSDDVFTARLKMTGLFIQHLKNERADGKKEFLEFINYGGAYYVPGSSVKGALITIMHLESLGIRDYIDEKFVIHDSLPIAPENITVYRTEKRPPEVNLMCVNPGVSFHLDIRKTGELKPELLRKNLEAYTRNQVMKAKPVVAKYKARQGRPANGADYYSEILDDLRNVTLAKDEYLINIGFGGGSWFKLYNDVPPPLFNNPGKRGKKEEAHTTFFVSEGNKLLQLGWCKLSIEELK